MNNMHSAPADEFYVANLFADGMIVPRDKPIVIWGRAPGSQNGRTVSAEFRGLRGSGVIDDGSFRFSLDGTLPASVEKGHGLTVSGALGTEKVFRDVIVGDIWTVSGQSNADLTFFGTLGSSAADIRALYRDYLARASEKDDIRILHQINWSLLGSGGRERLAVPQKDTFGSDRWKTADGKNVYGTSVLDSFSMLGYFFAKELYLADPSVPVGIMMSGCGGAPLSVLASPDARKSFPGSLRDRYMNIGDLVIPPSGIFNAFESPLLNIGITGMIFYQGESDACFSADYPDALAAYVKDMREKHGSDFQFLNVQLTSYGYESGGCPLDGPWDKVPEMRFAQAGIKIDGSIPGYEIIPTHDVGWREGDADGAHPYYKLEIGRRAARMAAAVVYGKGNVENEGFPVPRGFWRTAEGVEIEYRYAGGGLKTTDGAPVTGFEVLEGGKWIPAPAKISGNTVTVAAPGAAGVRYASALRYMPDDLPNLCSGTGNIAVPFCRMLR